MHLPARRETTSQLTENQGGRNQGRHGTRAEQMRAMTGPTAAELADETDSERDDEISPGQPGQDGEQAWPEGIGDRSSEGVRHRTAARNVMRERPPDDSSKQYRNTRQPDDEYPQSPNTSSDLATCGPSDSTRSS